MTSGGPYWNEDAQSWEYGSEDDGPVAATPPPGESSRTPAPRRPGPRSRTSTRPGGRVLRVAALVVVVFTIALTAALLKPSDDGKPDDPAPMEKPHSASPSAVGPTAPAGYRMVREKNLFRTAVPVGWKREVIDNSTIDYNGPNLDSYLSVFRVEGSTSEESFKTVRELSGFKELAEFRSFTKDQVSGHHMEYQYEGESRVWQVFESRFRATDGKLYGVAVYGGDRETRWLVADTTLRYFCPPGPPCTVLP
ncbi:hypothetical protein AB0G74_01950 [Streptomyces sp. NPDC020875]|uniref:hypothetical protein n=1 Tax=Streptomyces sp. NPDC020875 TaxID=3154898 RepID=UPI0033F0D759